MENRKNLALWASYNADALGLKCTFFENSLLAQLGIFDVEISMDFGKELIRGQGTSYSKHLAFNKALSECIERFFLNFKRYETSNGMAAHTSLIESELSAKYELVERDWFMTRFLTYTKFDLIPKEKLHPKFSKNFSEKNVDVDFFSMGKQSGLQGVLCVINGMKAKNSFGVILGSSVGELSVAAEKSFLEAFRNYIFMDRSSSLTIDQFKVICSEGKVRFQDHGRLALNLEYANEFSQKYLNFVQSSASLENNIPQINFEKISTESSPFSGAPIFISRASGEGFQQIYSGLASKNVLNESRLKKYCKRNGIEFNLNYDFPHPFN